MFHSEGDTQKDADKNHNNAILVTTPTLTDRYIQSDPNTFSPSW